MKPETNTNALTIAKTYIDGMAAKDVDKLMSVVADDIVCKSPSVNGRLIFETRSRLIDSTNSRSSPGCTY
jgi:hypothetical protein